MDLFSHDGRPIQTLAHWRDRCGPVSGRAWAEGGHARELARAWVEGSAEADVTSLLAELPVFGGVVLAQGSAAKETRFDDCGGDPRRHDLLVTARAATGTAVIGVEGKTDEPFEEPLDGWLMRARARSEPERADERLDRLTTAFFGTTLDEDPLLAPLRYQLVSALAGTLAEARAQDAERAVLLVHEFETRWTESAPLRRNAGDLEAFLGRLMPGVARTENDRRWIAGPGRVAGDGDWMPEETEVYVAKLVTRARPV
jgi:hypothetical protein